MNIHSFLDDFTIGLSALFLPKSKFFRESIESPTFNEHLQGINLLLPEINQGGKYGVYYSEHFENYMVYCYIPEKELFRIKIK